MIHFIYSIPPAATRAARLIGRLQRRAADQRMRPRPVSEGELRRFDGAFARRAPYSITVHLYEFLSQRAGVRLYNLLEPGGLRYEADDIILGHPWPEPNQITNRAMLDPQPCRLKALIFPIHHGLPEINAYARPYVEAADLVFGIMGDYWYDTLNDSAFASWKPKITRLDMAVDASAYLRLKRSFNPPGQRGYLYIGRNAPEKGVEVLSETMRRLPEYRCGWIGASEEIPFLKREASYADLTPDFVRELAGKYDFLVNISVSDANPTTILEAMAWGFPVACTPQSGYYNQPGLTSLSASDIAGNVAALRRLQEAPESELLALADASRRLVETRFNWQNFCQAVWSRLEAFTA